MALLTKSVEAIKGVEGETKAYMLMRMAQMIYPEGHPERLFLEWLHQWEGNLKEGIISLGIQAPPKGPKLLTRIKEAVTPALVSGWEAENAAAKGCGDE